jgi:hypothetical protein
MLSSAVTANQRHLESVRLRQQPLKNQDCGLVAATY